MTAFKALIEGLLGAIAFTAAANAADMPGNWTPPPPPRYVPLLSGWYLRGDIGYRWNSLGSVKSVVPTTSSKISDSVGLSIGAGYRYQWFRADITVDHGVTSPFRATTTLPVTQPQYTSSVDSTSALLNFYADFGTWYGFTPYAGAGVGVSYLRGIGYNDTSVVPNAQPLMAKDLHLSWAWMAGVAIQVQPQWLVDVGFRHLELGDVSMTANTVVPIPPTTLRSLSANELRIGLRYLFD